MGRHRTLLARVRRLEAPVVHPVLAQFGGQAGWEAFQVDAEVGMADGRYDLRDTPVILASVRRWVTLHPV